MATYLGSFIKSSTGSTSLSLPFTPTMVEFTIGSKSSGGAENDIAHFSQGGTDGTTSYAHSHLADGSVYISRVSDSYCLTHYGIVSGATSRVISATLTSFDTNGITLNFDRASPDYKIYLKAWN